MSLRALVAMLLFASPLWARNTVGVADGSDWRQYSQTYKIGWIDGFVSAMSDATGGTSTLCVFQLHVSVGSKEEKACASEVQGFNFEMIKYGQFLDGMDAFYKDFRNTEYPITWAMKLVRDQINGRSAEDIEKELLAWRQCRADKNKCLQLLQAPTATAPNPAKTPQ
jgi:hypothetical protein